MAVPVRVSIVIPVYNGERLLTETLQSVRAQSRRPHEVLLVDDGSTDRSAEIARSFAPDVTLMSQENRGESSARNRALAAATGTHVLFLDADDLLAPEAVERLSAAAATGPGVVALMGCAWFESDPAQPSRTKSATETIFFPKIIESNFAPPHCWLAPIDVVRRAGGFNEQVQVFEDWDLWWRVGLQSPPLVPVDYIGARYRRHPNSQLATTSTARRARGHADLMARMVNAFFEKPDILAAHGVQLFWSAWTALASSRSQGIEWPDLAPLATQIRRLAADGPPAVRQMRSAMVIRGLGPKIALSIRQFTTPGRRSPG